MAGGVSTSVGMSRGTGVSLYTGVSSPGGISDSGGGSIPSNAYVAEDGITPYVAEDGVTIYVGPSSFPPSASPYLNFSVASNSQYWMLFI